MKTLLLLVLFLIAGVAHAAESAPNTLVFKVYNGDPDDPKSLDFQINIGSRTGPTHFYKLGETISGTKWKIENFEYKAALDAAGREVDVSELRLRHLETKKTLLLPFDKAVALPASSK